MARALGFFNFSGKVGDKVYRIIKGKCYVTNAPSHYTMPQTPEAKARRDKFRLSRKLCSAVDRLLYSKLSWEEEVTRKTTRLGIMMKYFYSRISGYSLDNIRLVSNPDFTAQLIDFSFTDDKVKLRFSFPDIEANRIDKETVIAAESILYLLDPGSERKDKFNLIPLNSADYPLHPGQELEFEITLTRLQLEALDAYPENHFYAILIIKNLLLGGQSRKKLNCLVSETFKVKN